MSGGDSPPERSSRTALSESTAVFAVATLLAALYFRLTPARFGAGIVPDGGDPLFVLYILRWVSRHLYEGLAGFWDANVFHPLAGALGLSDHLVGPALLFGLAERLGASPAAGFNLLFFGSFGWAALSAFDVTRRLGYARFAACIVGFAFAFSHYRWQSLSQLHVLLAATLPWTIYLFDRLLVAPSWKRGAAFAAVYAINLAGGVYLGYAQHLALLAIVVLRWQRVASHLREPRGRWPLLAVGAVAAALAAAAFLPYLRFRDAHQVVTPIGWLAPFRTSLWNWLQVSLRSWPVTFLGHDSPFVGRAAALSIGLVPTLLLIVGIRRRARPAADGGGEPRRRRLRFVGGLLLVACAVAVGDWITHQVDFDNAMEAKPWLRLYRRAGWCALAGGILALVSLPERLRRFFARDDPRPAFAATAMIAVFAALPIGFFLLRNALPGFGALRVTGRIAALAVPFLMIYVAEGATALAAWSRRGGGRAVAVLAVAAMALEAQPLLRTVQWTPAPREADFPAYARWIAAHPEVEVVLELPFLLNWQEARRMYYSTLHWKPMVNGYSSYIPPVTLQLLAPVRKLPSPAALDAIAERGVTHVVVHFDEIPRRQREAYRKRWSRQPGGRRAAAPAVAYADGEVTIFALPPARAAAERP